MGNSKLQTVEQCKLAFDFVQKLFLEVSYFIKEVEGMLLEEGFVIGRPSGYQISSRSSSGLEAVNVNLWLLRKFAVFFAPQDTIISNKGQTTFLIDKPVKVLYLRLILDDSKLAEPMVYAGAIYDIQKTATTKWVKKFEQAMQHFEYNQGKIFKGDLQNINYEDAHIKFKGHLLEIPLFEINDSEAILEKVVKPSLSLFQQY